MPIKYPEIRERVEKYLNEFGKAINRNPDLGTAKRFIENLPSDLFTDASKERLIAAVDFYTRLKNMNGIVLKYIVVNGSAAHGYAKDTHDVDLFPVYQDDSFSDDDHHRVFSLISGLTAELTKKYGFEISPKPVPHSLVERIILSTADNPPYLVLGNKENFYGVYKKRGN
jgi:predicted nucleotidyltransferase